MPTQVAACGGRTMSTAASEGSEVVRLPQRTPFTMIDNPIIRSMDDYVSLGLYLDLMSRPPGWRINLRDLARSHKQGRIVLAASMTDLISRGLVFRVRFQDSSGRWATRTYVCSTAVTAAELADVRAQFRRCQIETTAELSQQDIDSKTQTGTGPMQPATLTAASPTGSSDPEDQGDLELTDTHAGVGQKRPLRPAGRQPAKEAVAGARLPKARFLASGDPASGSPTAGSPQSGPPGVAVLDAQRSDLKGNIPPPGPPPTTRQLVSAVQGQGEEDWTIKKLLELEHRHPGLLPEPAPDTNLQPGHDQPGQPAVSLAAPTAHTNSSPTGLPTPAQSRDVEEVLDAVREAWPSLGQRDETKLRDGVGRALDAISRARLIEHLVANTGGVRHPGRVLLARLDNLPAARPGPRTASPWCGQCASADYRWITTADSAPVRPCPDCSPQARHARH